MQQLNSLLGLPYPLVLASKSPRRRRLLEHIGFEFDIVDPDVDEDSVSTNLDSAKYVETLALMKAKRGLELANGPCITIGSDTTVVLNGEVLNKPVDKDDAIRMLTTLSGQTHSVHTGLALAHSVDQYKTTSRETRVTFRDLHPSEIEAYVDGGSPMDKAGAYGIQDDMGAVFVRNVEGCYYTIVGLPLELLYTTLKEFAEEISK